jgi:hypothetical protein
MTKEEIAALFGEEDAKEAAYIASKQTAPAVDEWGDPAPAPVAETPKPLSEKARKAIAGLTSDPLPADGVRMREIPALADVVAESDARRAEVAAVLPPDAPANSKDVPPPAKATRAKKADVAAAPQVVELGPATLAALANLLGK